MTGVLENQKKNDLKRVYTLLRQYDCPTLDKLLTRLYSDRNHLELAIACLEWLKRLRSGETPVVRLGNRRNTR